MGVVDGVDRGVDRQSENGEVAGGMDGAGCRSRPGLGGHDGQQRLVPFDGCVRRLCRSPVRIRGRNDRRGGRARAGGRVDRAGDENDRGSGERSNGGFAHDSFPIWKGEWVRRRRPGRKGERRVRFRSGDSPGKVSDACAFRSRDFVLVSDMAGGYTTNPEFQRSGGRRRRIHLDGAVDLPGGDLGQRSGGDGQLMRQQLPAHGENREVARTVQLPGGAVE